jgi:DNA polymerase elongation subunit (family B)
MKTIPNEKICINCIEYVNMPNPKPVKARELLKFEQGFVAAKVPPLLPVIFVWYRDQKTRERKRLRAGTFEPYFYAKETTMIPTYYYHKEKNERELLVRRIEGVKDRPSDSPNMKKVVTWLPAQVRVIRTLLESKGYGDDVYEADIEFIYRFLLDKKIKCSLEKTPSGWLPIDEDIPSNLMYAFIDLEVFSNRKPDPKKLRIGEKVICATIWDNYSKIYHLFYEYSHVLSLPDYGPDVQIHYCLNERSLLKDVATFLWKLDPDVIAGFNIDWDLTCLIKTMEQRHKLDPDILSPLKRVNVRTGKKRLGDILLDAPRARIMGRSILDILELYLKMHLSGLEEMSLEYIAQQEQLPVQKVVVPDFYDTWNKNPELIIRRNLSDVKIYVELEKKLNLIKFADEQRKLVGCRIEDTVSSKKMLDLFMMRLKEKNNIFPTARKRGAKYKGAFVLDPNPGLYGWVLQFDFSALYPTIMMCFNIDPDTFRDPKLSPEKNKLYILDEDHAFLKEPEGLIPKMLRTLKELRNEKKKLQKEALERNDEEAYKMYNLQEGVVKVLSNASYGVMGYRFRKGSKQTVESVTLAGRGLITFVKELIEGTGRKVIYGDTDSIFVEAKGKSLDECLAESKELQTLIHSSLPAFLSKFGKKEQPFNMDPAQIYSAYFILEAKKRYAGYIEWDSKRGTKLTYRYNIKGLETRRSDLSAFGKRIQKEVIHKLLTKITKDEMLKFLEAELNSFDQLPLAETGIPSAIGQPLDSYKGNAIQKTSAEYSNKWLHTQFDVGAKPKRIAIKSVPLRVEQSETLDGLPKGRVYRVKNLPLCEITKVLLGSLAQTNVIKETHPDGTFILDLDASNQKIDINYLQGYPDVHSLAIEPNTTLPPGFEIDYLKILEGTVKKKIEKLIAMIGITWEEIKLKQELMIVPKVPKKRKEKVDKKEKRKVKDDKQKVLTEFKC